MSTLNQRNNKKAGSANQHADFKKKHEQQAQNKCSLHGSSLGDESVFDHCEHDPDDAESNAKSSSKGEDRESGKASKHPHAGRSFDLDRDRARFRHVQIVRCN